MSPRTKSWTRVPLQANLDDEESHLTDGSMNQDSAWIRPASAARQRRNRIGEYRLRLVTEMCLLACLTCFGGILSAQEGARVTAADPQQQKFFEERIHRVLIAKCYECHSANATSLEGGLLLDSREAMRSGGDSGPAVVPGKLAESLLYRAITASEDSMPPDERLEPEVIDDFRKWIESGAFDPRDASETPGAWEPDYSEERQYWAFRPLQPVELPSVDDAAWPANQIDFFILRELERSGLKPAPVATPETLIRRVYFDLIGLPPTPAEVDAFVADPSEQAYAAIIDDLLQRPAYGERWAQHWLDVVRYAETEGFEYDRTLPDIWRYRDYVIEAFNGDKPYDQFLIEQLAGDELPSASNETQVATGFFRLGTVRRNAGNQKVASSRNEVLTERTDIIGSAILGLSIGCARCHDHKFDPISQQDYYRLQAFVGTTFEHNLSLLDSEEQRRLAALAEELESKIAELKERISGLNGDEEEKAQAEIKRLESELPAQGPTICGVQNDFAQASPIQVLRRGDPELPGALVGMRLPSVLADVDQPELPFGTANPRTQLAHDIIRSQSALVARVVVNRIWQQHFAVGLVQTPNDFGKNGAQASHPELLEYLGQAFIDGGWKFKPLHRKIMLSHAYRQSSKSNLAERAQEIDPDNRLLWHFPKRRLSGEEIRDAMLAVTGKLNPEMGGESVILPVEQELVDQLYKPSQWAVTPDVGQHYRRSIYLFAKRNLRLPFMEVFDQPAAQTSCASREQSTHARQALELLNGPIANELALAFADRLRRESGEDPDKIVGQAFRMTTARLPSAGEFDLARDFLVEVGLNEFALAMFNINAFLYVD